MRAAAIWRAVAAALTGLALAAAAPPASDAPVPKPAVKVMPAYPVEANFTGMEGKAVAIATVEADGSVSSVAVEAETPADFGFGAAAVEALKQWQFEPGRPGRYRVTMEFRPPPEPTIVKRVQPHFPPKAANAGIQGSAVVRISISGKGTVDGVAVVGENPPGYGFGEAARDATVQWLFSPGLPGDYLITVRFRIQGEGDTIEAKASELPLAPRPSRMRAPEMPEAAEREGIKGWAEVLVRIDYHGKVTHAAAGHEEPAGYGFAEAAFKAVIHWQFKGAAVGNYRVRVNFPFDEGD